MDAEPRKEQPMSERETTPDITSDLDATANEVQQDRGRCCDCGMCRPRKQIAAFRIAKPIPRIDLGYGAIGLSVVCFHGFTGIEFGRIDPGPHEAGSPLELRGQTKLRLHFETVEAIDALDQCLKAVREMLS